MSDGISTSFLEAMVMGSFPVQSWTSCAGEWIVDGKSGILVPPDDPAPVAAALRRALTDDRLVDAAAERNRAEAGRRLDGPRAGPRGRAPSTRRSASREPRPGPGQRRHPRLQRRELPRAGGGQRARAGPPAPRGAGGERRLHRRGSHRRGGEALREPDPLPGEAERRGRLGAQPRDRGDARGVVLLALPRRRLPAPQGVGAGGAARQRAARRGALLRLRLHRPGREPARGEALPGASPGRCGRSSCAATP